MIAINLLPVRKNMRESLKNGWSAPIYGESERVSIDYALAEKNRCLINNQASMEMDCVKVLRTKLLAMTRANNWRTIMVTSVQSGEGKTITSINLAFAMAREHEQTVILVETDLRMPSICNYLGINARKGLSDYFINDIPLCNIILWPSVEKLSIIPAGRPLPESTEVLGSPKMEQLVSEMKNRYGDRYIFFDFPPLLAAADPLAFMPYVDCVLMVVEANRTSARDIKNALALIPENKLLGLILNKDDNPQKPFYGY